MQGAQAYCVAQLVQSWPSQLFIITWTIVLLRNRPIVRYGSTDHARPQSRDNKKKSDPVDVATWYMRWTSVTPVSAECYDRDKMETLARRDRTLFLRRFTNKVVFENSLLVNLPTVLVLPTTLTTLTISLFIGLLKLVRLYSKTFTTNKDSPWYCVFLHATQS